MICKLAALALLAAGCGGGDDDSAATDSTSPTTATTAAVSTASRGRPGAATRSPLASLVCPAPDTQDPPGW